MKKVYYKGEAYDFKVTGDIPGARQFQLYSNGVFTHYVNEQDLDKKSIASMVLDGYYRSFRSKRSAILS